MAQLIGICSIAFAIALIITTGIYRKEGKSMNFGDWIIVVLLSAVLAVFLLFLLVFAICG